MACFNVCTCSLDQGSLSDAKEFNPDNDEEHDEAPEEDGFCQQGGRRRHSSESEQTREQRQQEKQQAPFQDNRVPTPKNPRWNSGSDGRSGNEWAVRSDRTFPTSAKLLVDRSFHPLRTPGSQVCENASQADPDDTNLATAASAINGIAVQWQTDWRPTPFIAPFAALDGRHLR
jgi:hypothetical protein